MVRQRILLWTLVGLATTGGGHWSPPIHAQEETPPDLIQLVVDLLADQDQEVRSLGLEQVRTEVPGPAATERFASLLDGLSPDAQVGLLGALADRGDSAARAAILKQWQNSPHPPVKVAAIRAIGRLGQADDASTLVQTLREGSSEEQQAAQASLVQLRGEGVTAVLAAALEPTVPVTTRLALVQVATTRRDRQILSALHKLAQDADSNLRRAAMSSLAQLATPSDLAPIAPSLQAAQRGAERDAAEKAIAAICAKEPDADRRALPVLAVIAQQPEREQRQWLSLLGRIGGEPARVEIEKAIQSTDKSLHDLGIRALCNWPDASLLARFRELIEREPLPEHRQALLRALIRVAALPDQRTDEQRLQALQEALKLCRRDADRQFVIQRARAIRTIESLRFLLPYVEQRAFAEAACESIVELAHHRKLREPNKAEFTQALDRVIAVSQNATVKLRAERYKLGQTWTEGAQSQ